ncbi:MAG: hypothetical protein ACE5J5_06080 [Candidatus Hydrothermarchaeales archaeon]
MSGFWMGVLAFLILLFIIWILEDEIGKEGVFWLFSSLGVLFGAISVYAVAKNSPNERNYIVLAVFFVLIAIIYYEEEEEELPEVEERPKKKRKKKSKKKRKFKGK